MKNFILLSAAILLGCVLSGPGNLFAADVINSQPTGASTAKPAAPAADFPGEDLSQLSLTELVKRAWEASGRQDYDKLDQLFQTALSSYEQPAMAQHSSLTTFPLRDKMKDYQIMNDVAAMHFIIGEAKRNRAQCDEAIKVLEKGMREYPYAQVWDPSRGGYWSVAEKSQQVVDDCKGKSEEGQRVKAMVSSPVQTAPGTDVVVDYEKYGKFSGVGTKEYKYQMDALTPLAKAVGEGIYPNTGDIYKNPRVKVLYRENRLNGSQWNFVNTTDLEAAYFKWATAMENPGVKLYYTALIFEKAGMYLEAIKAYHALVVHFSNSSGVTYWHTPWYPGQAAVAKIYNILRQHPELGLVYVGGKVRVINSTDNDASNDVFMVWPGKIEKAVAVKALAPKKMKVKRYRGGRKVKLAQYIDGHWQMLVDGKPYMIKGLTYTPTKIGESPDNKTLDNWMYQDTNGNGLPDGPYDSWVDRNGNGIQDVDEPVVGDFQLLKEMGVNTLRIYQNGLKINVPLLQDMYKKYGIRVIMGDFLGKYTMGSGADWASGTDYEDPKHQANMMKSVEEMVRAYKHEPFLLMWLLGNENNYGVACNADKKPEAYFKFVNAVAKRIKQLDPDHPVAICNGDALYLDIFGKVAPDVDVYGANIYRGDYGFGAFWDDVRTLADRPAFITEYGAPAYSKLTSLEKSEEDQAAYHRGNWMDIQANAGVVDAEGNSIGGVAFEWMDEWWKNYDPYKHDTRADASGPFAGGYYFEEWFGLTGQGEGKSSPFLRELRKAYYAYREMWNKN